jgi:hypothetical protein
MNVSLGDAALPRSAARHFVLVLVVGAALTAPGCASLMSSAASGLADNLSAAVLNQNDPETVRDGAPAYLLLLDSFLEGSPNDPSLLASAASLYAAYGSIFADDPARASRLTERARLYGSRALCLEFRQSCGWSGMNFERFDASLADLEPRHAELVYSYAAASLAWIRAHSDDWNALAELPQMEALLQRYLEISDEAGQGTVYTWLGVLTTLRPPSLGGEPEQGKVYFERAIELTDGRDLGAKVEYARGYARLLYERELHDRLLEEVLAADPEAQGYTLTNVLAQRDAEQLLASADDYF